MIGSIAPRAISMLLTVILSAPLGSAQTPAAVPAQESPAPSKLPVATTTGSELAITVLEGNNAVNSIPLLRSVAPVVEIRDKNDFPLEGATVVFTIPAQGPGGIFPQGGTSFTTRSDAHGQATAPAIVPRVAGKFQITVTATSGNLKTEATITQTNTSGAYIGPGMSARPWYKRKLVWAIAGGAVVATIVVVLTRGSSAATPTTIAITPGTPVFR